MKIKLFASFASAAIPIGTLSGISISASDAPDGVLTYQAKAAHDALVVRSETYRPGDPDSVTTRFGRSATVTSADTIAWFHSHTANDPYIPPVVTHECSEWRWSVGGTPYSYSAHRSCRLNNYPRPCVALGGWSGGYHLNEYTDSWIQTSGNYAFTYNELTTQWDHFCLGEEFYRYIPATHQGRTFAPYA